MTGFLEKKQWIFTLVLGIISLIIGVSIVAYSVIVTKNGPIPDLGDFAVGFLFIGLGLGYMICSSTVRKLEERIKGLEKNYALEL